MEQPKPFARNAAEAERELRPMLAAHAEALGGSLLEFWAAEPCVHEVVSSDHERRWLEAWFGTEYKLPDLATWVIDNDLVDMCLYHVLPSSAYAIRVKFEVSVVVSEG